MAHFEMEFELTGLKVKIKSEREDAPKALESVQQHIGSMLQSAAGLGAGELSGKPLPNNVEPPTIEGRSALETAPAAKSKSNKGKRSSTGTSTPINLSHDAALYGFPKQAWNTAQKAMWLLFILEKQTGTKEADTGVLTATFNKFFKEFGQITTTNVTRDLGKARAVKGFVSSDASKDPQTWYLLEAGKKEVERLVRATNTESPSA